jgi:cation:H+ antiporter
MIALVWIIIFIVSLVVLVKGADWLLQSAEKIGLAFGLSPFIVGVVIVGAGTSFPELISSLAAVLKGASEIVTANAVGSNIANILLVVGASAVVGKRLVVKKNLIDLDLPLLAISTVLFLGVVYDGRVRFIEALLLLTAYIIYLAYSMIHPDEDREGVLPSRVTRRKRNIKKRPGVSKKDYLLLIVGIFGLVLGAKYLVDSVVAMSEIFNIGTGAIAIIAVAFGTSLPELLVSIKAALKGKSEIALGNIFGSNAFNILVVMSLPALLGNLIVDAPTLAIGVPTMLLATFLFIVSGISRKIHLWEGAMYLVVYVMFTGKIFDLF